jgi:hypothetical protein
MSMFCESARLNPTVQGMLLDKAAQRTLTLNVHTGWKNCDIDFYRFFSIASIPGTPVPSFSI